MKRETPEEWERREKELEEMGFKGGQGRSNHEVYESAVICSLIGWMFVLLIAAFLVAWITQKITGA